jgi:hypothetical protein
MVIIANRQNNNEKENGLLDYITIYLNKIKYSKDDRKWYGVANMVQDKANSKYYTVLIKENFKQRDFTISEIKHLHISEKTYNEILRAYKVHEFIRKNKQTS